MATSSRGIVGPLERAAEPLAAPRVPKGRRVTDGMRRLVTAPPARAWDLVLHEPEPAEAPPAALVISWRDPDGHRGRGTLGGLPAAARQAPLRVWTPAVETLLTRVAWPGRSRAKLVQALPFLLEEQLLMEPEQLNFTHQPTAAGIMVAVTSAERLGAWRAAFAQAGLAASFCPLTLGLPFVQGQWTCRFADGQWAVRTGPYGGFGAMGRASAPPAPFLQALAEAATAGEAPAQIRLCDGDEALRALLEARLGVRVILDDNPVGAVGTLPFRLGETKGAMAASALTALRSLRPALIVAALGLCFSFAAMMAQWAHLGAAHGRLRQAQAQIFAQNFPDVPVLNPARQMQSETQALLARTGGADGFLALLGRAAPALKPLGTAGLLGLRYAPGVLRVQVQVADFGALTALEHALAARGLVVAAHHVMSRRNAVRAQLAVRRQSA